MNKKSKDGQVSQKSSRSTSKTESVKPKAGDQSKLLATPQIIAIGASAGGLEPFERFFDATPIESGLAFVIIQHLSPSFESMMDELLARHSAMRIEIIQDGMKIEPNAIYLNQPRTEVAIDGSEFKVSSSSEHEGLHLPINLFFESLALQRGHEAIGVILSGTGSDGTLGCEAIKSANGTVFVQEPTSAKFDGMPTSVISKQLADAIDVPERLPGLVLRHVRGDVLPELLQNLYDPNGDPHINLLALLKAEFGTDFTYYKSSTIGRRIQRRLDVRACSDIQSYIEYVTEDPNELKELYRDILIDVTTFFRDPDSFDILNRDVVAALSSKMSEENQIRIWIAGCATGQEAYSVGIAFMEYARQNQLALNIKVLATDVHDQSLNVASAGLYDRNSVKGLRPELLERYFDEIDGNYRVRPNLRRLIVFSRQDLIKDPPFTRLDLICCRNVLIYFKEVAQQKVLSLFHFGLRKDGYLFLGPSETIGKLQSEFYTAHQKWRIFRKLRDIRLAEPVSILPSNGSGSAGADSSGRVVESTSAFDSFGFRPEGRKAFNDAMQSMLTRYAPAGFLLSQSGELAHVFGDAGDYISIIEGSFSRRIVDLIHSDLKITVSTGLERIKMADGNPFNRRVFVTDDQGTRKPVVVSLNKLSEEKQDVGFVLLTIESEKIVPDGSDGSSLAPVEEVQETSDALYLRLDELERDLRFSEESLQSTIEELETSNEELQATNEELMASNEELQSTNEELHSVNEELYTVSAEHQRKIDELTEVTSDLDNLLQGTRIGNIFLNHDLCIRRYTPAAENTFNLRPQDLGRPFSHITYNFEFGGLPELIAQVFSDGKTREREVGVKENSYLLRILRHTNEQDAEHGIIITIFDITALKSAQQDLTDMAGLYADVLADISESIVRWNADDAQVTYCNNVFAQFEGKSVERILGTTVKNYLPDTEFSEVRKKLNDLKSGKFIVIHFSKTDASGKKRILKGAVRAIGNGDSKGAEFQCTMFDVTDDTAYLHALESLIDVTGNVDDDYLSRIYKFLETGANYLDIDQGTFVRSHDQKFTIETYYGENKADYPLNTDLDLAQSMCSVVAETQSDFSVSDILSSEHQNHPAVDRENLKSFVAAPIFVAGQFYGAICFFSSQKAMVPAFSEQQVSFVKLLGQWLSYKVERRTQLEALRRSEEELALIFNNVPARIWYKDAHNRILRLNKTAADSMGLSIEAATGADTYDLFPEIAKKYHDDDLAVINSGNPIYGMLEEYIPANGPRGWINTDKIPHNDVQTGDQNLLVISTDVTDLKNSEVNLAGLNKELKQQRENYLYLYRNTPVMMHSIDAEGNILEVSNHWLTKLGYERAEVIGKKSSEFLSEASRKRAIEEILPQFWKDGYCLDIAYEFIRKDGSLLEVELSGTIDTSHESSTRTLGVLVDVSERNRAWDELEEKNQELQMANEGLNRFAYVASHDLQEPLRKIRQFGDLLDEECGEKLNEDGHYFLDVMRNSASRLSRLISDLLAYSRTSNAELKLQKLDLSDIVTDAISSMEVIVKETDAKIEIGNLPTVSADQTMVTQLFSNLLSNAVKYRDETRQPIIKFECEPKNGGCEIRITDNGIGIRQENMSDIFDPFTRGYTGTTQSGTGIGLAICKSVCDRHGWSIKASSELGSGAVFTIGIKSV